MCCTYFRDRAQILRKCLRCEMFLFSCFSASGEASDIAAPEVTDSDLPLADCMDEDSNPYDGDRLIKLMLRLQNISKSKHPVNKSLLWDQPHQNMVKVQF